MKLKIKTSRDFDLPKNEVADEPLFSKPKGGSGTFVYRHGRLWHKHEVNNVDDHDSKRSDLAAPAVIGDVPEHLNHATGEIVSTRRRHREILRDHNLVEYGNDMAPKRSTHSKGEIARTIKESIDQLEAGYVNPEEGLMPEGYVEEEVHDLDDIEVDVETVQDGQYIRADGKKE